METCNLIALGGISLKFYQLQNWGTVPCLDTAGWGWVSMKKNHWQNINHNTEVAHL